MHAIKRSDKPKILPLSTIVGAQGGWPRIDVSEWPTILAVEYVSNRRFLVGIIISELLTEFATTLGDERILIKSSGRLLDFCLTENGAALVKAGATNPFALLPLSLMAAHADGSVRNVVDKRLPHFQSQLALALERVPAEQDEKIRADLERMESGLATASRGGDFSQEVERERRKRRSFSDHSTRVEDEKHGPNR
jgi:hypothetical protein